MAKGRNEAIGRPENRNGTSPQQSRSFRSVTRLSWSQTAIRRLLEAGHEDRARQAWTGRAMMLPMAFYRTLEVVVARKAVDIGEPASAMLSGDEDTALHRLKRGRSQS